MALSEDVRRPIVRAAAAADGLELLVLFGSRARGEENPRSDWDFAYLAGDRFDADELSARLVSLLRTEQVDLVDLDRSNGLLRMRAATDGELLHEAVEGRFTRFQLAAALFWCDVEPILTPAYAAILSGLDR